MRVGVRRRAMPMSGERQSTLAIRRRAMLSWTMITTKTGEPMPTTPALAAWRRRLRHSSFSAPAVLRRRALRRRHVTITPEPSRCLPDAATGLLSRFAEACQRYTWYLPRLAPPPAPRLERPQNRVCFPGMKTPVITCAAQKARRT